MEFIVNVKLYVGAPTAVTVWAEVYSCVSEWTWEHLVPHKPVT